jgi:hypothetical protein
MQIYGNLCVMKQYVIDELRPGDYRLLKSRLDDKFGASEVDGIYWIPVDLKFLTEEQASHKDCMPYYFAVVLEPNLLACELLIRTKNKIRCSCIGYADSALRNFIIEFADSLFESLDIKT